ncbi:pyruvate kinase [Ketogulonicigenium vulgare]|uniref:Pyruvate kinase n=1 Tax=Ketogulonicigenium vulgare (strain WSH-001) TaxID=759362 RepID=F9Y8A3_KETVW|nr:pyruvate kinase [Ketogulonicigenium vulgare]ADO41389.1 pyruvate kinase [Ketogulonicigenium vulgare Y25]AEM42389.1 Pyruvate kinase [Ketogulonicigenium vulgare WSH-001]ALJ80011.1 pyruvate kinase [Ketogulonicigenium vulgare]ANW32897.1 pyruvate kinase [Ketogulonicigenium vulgare]AOZ53473.1 pyruvate kinase [Ketogulonicigenium vulgare]
MKRHRNVKIVATLGPSSSSYAMIRALVEAGADVFRLNMSHGTHDEQRDRYDIIRQVEADLGVPIAVLADLQGPKLRVGTFADGPVDLSVGAPFRLDLDPTPGDIHRVQLPHHEIFAALRPGATLLVNDGKIRLRVDQCGADFADCTVTVGGAISNRKGVNVPDVVLPLAALSEKDLGDLEFACQLGADWIALSFVQRAADVEQARALVGDRAAILAKIEKPAAVDDFDKILAVSDGIMVARGDLGVELPVAAVPPIQKRLITACRAAAKPVIVATQMLESMIESPMPTRAEVSDVANAIYEGADAVMLSAESAAGKFPLEAVGTMDSVATEVESDPHYRELLDSTRKAVRTTIAEGMVAAAREIADTTDVRAICCYSRSGKTANLVARERPRTPILMLTPLVPTARRMCLSWGTICRMTETVDEFRSAVVAAVRIAVAENLAEKTDHVVVVAGVPFNVVGSTNVLRVAPCDERLIYGTDMA